MLINFEEHGFRVTARKLPESCTSCPFWGVDLKNLEDGICYLTGHTIKTDGPQDIQRMDDCIIEQMKATTKNDLGVECISRAEVLKIFDEWFVTCDIADKKASPKAKIKALPSITPIRPKGHWISHREHCENLGVMPSGLGAYEWCSNCDCGIDVREWHRNNYNYCPNCGSDNREVEE